MTHVSTTETKMKNRVSPRLPPTPPIRAVTAAYPLAARNMQTCDYFRLQLPLFLATRVRPSPSQI